MAEAFPRNLLCFGDNLGFLKDFPGESVDLIYLDPPFNSQQSYNVLFKETTGAPEAAQIKAFEDTWTWDMEANKALTEIQQSSEVPAPLAELTKTFMDFLKPSPMSAYLVQMAVRLVQMHRVLKPTGSLYLHCDPTASHYLKLVLDAIFGPTNFVSEIIWKRTHAHGGARGLGRVHDTILFYAKSGQYTWNRRYVSYSEEYKGNFFRFEDSDGRKYRATILTGSGTRNGSSGKPWRGIDPTKSGRHWAIPGYMRNQLPNPKTETVQEALDQLDNMGRILWPKKADGVPSFKQYIDDLPGAEIQDVWTDIPPISAAACERLGYPTQKPLDLLRRIVGASSNPGDVILDPFCGCGTTIDAVETLNREMGCGPVARPPSAVQAGAKASQPGAAGLHKPRRWIGIDVTHIAIGLIKHRLATRFSPPPDFEERGVPVSAAGARALAAKDAFDFQYWTLGLIGARPVGGRPKKGADKGVDGVRYFHDEQKGGAWVAKTMLVQVKSGHVKAGDIRDFVGTLSREGAELGVFITIEEPTQPMRTEAASAGMYVSPWDKQSYPKVQILTIDELLKDSHRPNPACLQIPGGSGGPSVTLPEAPKHKPKRVRQDKIEFGDGTGSM